MAALIFDKRPTPPDNSGDHRIDLRVLAADALSGVGLLRRRTDVDAQRIGVWGFSQGGWVAPIVAAEDGNLAFVIAVSAAGVTYAEQLKYANATRLRSRGFAEAHVAEALAALDALDDHVRGRTSAEAATRALHAATAAPWFPHVNLPRVLPSAHERATSVRWRNLDLDPGSYWSRVRAPVLLIYGEHDQAVPVDASVAAIQQALGRAGNRNVRVRVFAGADHEVRPAPELPATMLTWLRERQVTAAASSRRRSLGQ